MKIAVITGASSGLGREFARQIPKCYKNLDELWLIARNTERLESVKQSLLEKEGIYCRIYNKDLGNDAIYEQLQQDMESLKPDIRMLVNAAGFGKTGTISETDTTVLTSMVDINCRALTRLTSLCLPYCLPGSRIVNLASAAAFAPQPGFAVYAATKSYVLSYSRALARELKERHVFVTAVCPGPVDTPFFQTAGNPSNAAKEKVMVMPEQVVRKALLDVRKRKSLSIYGLPMKGAKLAAKLAPDSVTDWFMSRLSQQESRK